MEIVLPIKDIIKLCMDIKDPSEKIKSLSLSYSDMIDKILSDIDIYEPEELCAVSDILFCDSDFNTYKEAWDKYKDKVINFKDDILIEWLMTYKPGKCNTNSEDIALAWLLYNKYNVNEFSDLTSEVKESLITLFTVCGLPEEIVKYQTKKHYIDELLLFEDLAFIENNKFNIDFDTKEIKELLCIVVKNNKITQLYKLRALCSLVSTFKPSNQFDRKYGDAFILEIFESGQWIEEEINIWKEEFNVDFEWVNADVINDQINSSHQQEANYISEKLKINPNYRHD